MVTVVVANKEENGLDIELWLMSCRVLKRGMEDIVMNVLIEQAEKLGVSRITGHYYPTAKNGMVKDFYGLMGFTKISEDAEGNSEWSLMVEQYRKREIHMKVENHL